MITDNAFFSKLNNEGVLLSANILNPDSGTKSERDAANAEFQRFVYDTYETLYKIESRVNAGKPSSSIFCRMDISLIVNEKTKQVHYFVNEFERAHTTSLWSNKPGNKLRASTAPINMLGNTFAEAFYDWMSYICSPY